LESEAKLKIQEEIRAGSFQLAWSYILDYENSKNPFQERKEQIGGWKKYAEQDIHENAKLTGFADTLNKKGFQKLDSLHIACAIFMKCDYFLTTDDSILKKAALLNEIHIDDPIGFIKEVAL